MYVVVKIGKEMLFANLTNDNQFLHISGDPMEIDRVRATFIKKIDSWYIIKKKNENAKVDEHFMNQYGLIPTGLWVELINTCNTFGIGLQFCDDFVYRTRDLVLTEESFKRYVDKLFEKSGITPKQYQIDGAFNMLSYKNCCVEVSTSGGKTLMSYILFRYMKDVVGLKHILFVTPKTNLTTQSANKFIKYDTDNGLDIDWTYGEIHADAKKKESYNENIVFGNYQSVCRKQPEFFDVFDAVIMDECHHSKCTSCRTIIRKCKNVKYKIGMTGTFPAEGSYNNFVLQTYLGPVVYRLSSYELINEEKFATPVHVNMIGLRYLDESKMKPLYEVRCVDKKDDPTIGGKIMNKEKDLMRGSDLRFRYICNMVSKVTKNSLVLFSDIQDEYGRRIYNYLKDNTDKHVFYIDGETSTKLRDNIIASMEADVDENTIIVASMQCFSEGIDIANMWNIFLVESTKSENTLAQILGRGMRRYEGKDKTVMVDFVDDFRYGDGDKRNNYLWKHGMERMSIYSKRGFPCKIYNVDLINKDKYSKSVALF